jgi:hypothetical protein
MINLTIFFLKLYDITNIESHVFYLNANPNLKYCILPVAYFIYALDCAAGEGKSWLAKIPFMAKH